MLDRPGITTDELLRRLHSRGLEVTRNMLGQDVKAGYLPLLVMEPRGREGIGRFWLPFAAERAVYLYRLRRRGVQGDLLRVLLFLRDGWGWEQVRPICERGLQKVLAAQAAPVRQHLRTVTPKNLSFTLDDAAAGLFQSNALPAFIWGMNFFGEPLPGGSLQPLFAAFRNVYDSDVPESAALEAERVVRDSGLTNERLLATIQAADAVQADRAWQRFQDLLRWIRSLQHAVLIDRGAKGFSSNPLTLCGRSRVELQEMGRSLPGRITPAQMLASFFALCLIEPWQNEGGNIETDPTRGTT
jgi:hypothetical protein